MKRNIFGRITGAGLLIVLLLSGGGIVAQAAAPERIGAEIEAYAAEHAATTAGMAVSVFRADGTVYQNRFGYADVENRIPVNGNTVFEWGSVTKLLVWVSVMQLWEAGKLDLDADVRDYLPEGFLTNLRYDTPVTMLHLMNHNAGFQEMIFDLYLKDENDVLPLGEALQAHEPEQIYAPGTVTAYSNWGVALAGYIVERVSGQPFYDYVHAHIFDVLGMEHTALAPDLSDNPWVAEQRKTLQCYTTETKLIPDCFYHIALYPAGMCTGTLEDFTAFGQALLAESCPLFALSGTREILFTPTSYHADGTTPKNAHGFWMIPLGVETYGHGGNTAGCSSYLLLDIDGGLGMAVMTNQGGEQVYNYKMPELLFGAYNDTSRTLPKGIYRGARAVRKGPAKLESVGYKGFSAEDLEEYWAVSPDGTLVSYPYGDLLRIPAGTLVLELGLLLLLALGAVFSAGYLLAWPVGALVRRTRKKDALPLDRTRALRRWGAALQLALTLTVGSIVLCLLSYVPVRVCVPLFAFCGVLALGMLAVLVLWIFRKPADAPRKSMRAVNVLSCVFLAGVFVNVVYWELYMFWAV